MEKLITVVQKVGRFGIYRTMFGDYIVLNEFWNAPKYVGRYPTLELAYDCAEFEYDNANERSE